MVKRERSEKAASDFIKAYGACTSVDCQYDPDVATTRWRKLVYNGSFNTMSTILGLDTTRMRIYEHIIDDLIRPLMLEIKATALAAGARLPDDVVETMIRVDPADTYFKPSMCQDVEKVGSFIFLSSNSAYVMWS